MVLETLRYADEVNKAPSYFRDIGDTKPDPDLLDMAATLIEKKAGEFDANEFQNRYVDALKELIAEKRRRRARGSSRIPTTARPPKGSNVIDLMAALKKSLGDDEASGKARRPRSRQRRSAAAKKAPAKKAAPARKRA